MIPRYSKPFIALVTSLSIIFCLLIVPAHAFHEKYANHEARNPDQYKDLMEKPLWERIAPTSEALTEYLKLDNEIYGYPETPVSAQPDEKMLADFQAAMKELPEPVIKQASEHLAGVFTVKELGTTGFCETLKGFKENRLGIIVIDLNYINKPANEWTSWRTNSPFALDGHTEVRAHIEGPASNNRKQTIQYILIHEIGHLMGAALDVHPDWNEGGAPEKYSFSKMSWVKPGDKVVSKFDKVFPMRSSLRFYSFKNSPISSASIPECYAQLRRTDFCTLYAAANMWDDFAEAYTVYVHGILQKKPWRVDIYTDGKKVDSFESPLLAGQVPEKKAFLDAIFEQKK